MYRIYSLIKGPLFCSQFGDQLIADLSELLDLLILWETERREEVFRHWWYTEKMFLFNRLHVHIYTNWAVLKLPSGGM